MRLSNWLKLAGLCFPVWASLTGCANPRYHFGSSDTLGIDHRPERRLSRGGESPRLDRLENVIESPSRLPLIPDPPPDLPSDETLAALEQYLDDNGIGDLNIAVAEYAPRSQWERLKANRQMNAAWKYPLGSVSLLFTTIIPDRVIDRTFYNPYTNTLVINSDDVPEVLAAAAYAKDVRTRQWRGPYALMSHLPVLSLVSSVTATNDVLSYARHLDDWELEKDSYRMLYPRLGAEGAVTFIPVSTILLQPLVMMGGGVVGRSVAEVQVNRLEGERQVRPRSPEGKSPEALWASREPIDPASDDHRVTPVDAVFSDMDDVRDVVAPEG
ncbi:MAG TPA: hypothetical protein VM510_13760 [Caulifigura sp.]|nr:hypothetical protein [Caulifigura sp.]